MRLSDALGNTTLLITIGASFLIPLSIALYKLVHAVRILFENNLKQRKAFQKAAASRKSAPAVPTFVRHDDIVRLTEEQQKQKNHAEELIRLGKPKEAALIYRQLTLDRKAIQTLEDAGLVKEACDILLEKNVPNRAGILYSRKGYHPEAGQCFLMAKRFSDAGNAFSKAANRNYQFFHNAAEAYILAAQFSEAIACYESLLDWKKSVELCLQEKNHIRLFSLFLNPLFPTHAFHNVLVEIYPIVLKELCNSPKNAQDMGVVAAKWGEDFRIAPTLQKMRNDKLLHRCFLSGAGQAHLHSWINSLHLTQESDEISAFSAFAEALQEISLYAISAQLYEKLNRKADAVRCYIVAGRMDCIQTLFANDTKSAQEIQLCVDRFHAAAKNLAKNQNSAHFWQEVNSILERVSK